MQRHLILAWVLSVCSTLRKSQAKTLAQLVAAAVPSDRCDLPSAVSVKEFHASRGCYRGSCPTGGLAANGHDSRLGSGPIQGRAFLHTRNRQTCRDVRGRNCELVMLGRNVGRVKSVAQHQPTGLLSLRLRPAPACAVQHDTTDTPLAIRTFSGTPRLLPLTCCVYASSTEPRRQARHRFLIHPSASDTRENPASPVGRRMHIDRSGGTGRGVR
jgi:hypothetical protein